MRRRHVFTPTVDKVEQRLSLSSVVARPPVEAQITQLQVATIPSATGRFTPVPNGGQQIIAILIGLVAKPS